MAEPLETRVDFPKYQRWMNRMVGRDCPMKVFDAAGRLVWGEDAAGDADLAQRLLAAQSDGTNVHRIDGENGATVLYRGLHIGRSGAAPAAWAAVTPEQNRGIDSAVDLDRVAEALEDAVIGMVGEARSRSELEQMTEELGECYEELHLVYALDAHISGRTGQDESELRSLLASVAEHMRADVAVFVQPAEKLCVYATALSKDISNLDLVLVETRGDLFRFVQSGKETVVLNEADDPRRPFVFTDMPYRVLASPVRTGTKIDGMVVLLNHMHKPPFANSDRRLLEVLANQLSSLARSFLLVRNMAKFTDQLATVMVEAVEAKDPYTRGHSERVNFLSMEIGKAMNLSADELQDLHWGSLLHDVGKIGIPDAVLSKPSRLTKDEYTFIQVHPERSYEILRNVEHLETAVLGARHHQEMWDGGGYPHGLKGERIPLLARIIAIADTYDSITSSRAYRAGRSHEIAMREIDRVCGKQLDPGIVDVFRKICETEPEWLQRFSIRREKLA
jgi:HD-GYP domain-containing protein (c-di-GMP phosphodiesterase class II)